MALPEDLQKTYDKLTEKQKRFVDLWNGDQEETAKVAGYSDAKKAGHLCLKNNNICQLIKFKRDAELTPLILSRKERQEFWTKVVNGEIKTKTFNKDGEEVEVPPKMKDRLKASELLGKSEGDFLDRVSITDDRPAIPEIADSLTEKELKDLCKNVLG